MEAESSNRKCDHLFISYAWEDGALAEWLTLRLTAEGYLVWCDRFKILGGERWPEDVDEAIRNQTFRMLHLVSRHSLHKPNPVKERQLALALEKERDSELLIPLNVDGTRPSDLPWQIVDVAYIPFQSWAEGFGQLLKKLRSVGAPRPLGEDGRGTAASAFMVPSVVLPEKERVYSNWFLFTGIPPAIQRFKATRQADLGRSSSSLAEWPHRELNPTTFLSLVKPPRKVLSGTLRSAGGVSWADVEAVDGVNSRTLLFELLNKSLERRCRALGLVPFDRGAPWKGVFFPAGLLPSDRLMVALPDARKSWVRAGGRRRSGAGHFLHRLGFVLRARRGAGSDYVAELLLRVYVMDESGQPTPGRSGFRRGVRVRRGWWNRQHMLRQAAVMGFLCGGRDRVSLAADGVGGFGISGEPLSYEVPLRINEAAAVMGGDGDMESLEAFDAIEEIVGGDDE